MKEQKVIARATELSAVENITQCSQASVDKEFEITLQISLDSREKGGAKKD